MHLLHSDRAQSSGQSSGQRTWKCYMLRTVAVVFAGTSRASTLQQLSSPTALPGLLLPIDTLLTKLYCVLLVAAVGLKKFLKKNAVGDTLAVLDAKLGNIIKEKLDIPCVSK